MYDRCSKTIRPLLVAGVASKDGESRTSFSHDLLFFVTSHISKGFSRSFARDLFLERRSRENALVLLFCEKTRFLGHSQLRDEREREVSLDYRRLASYLVDSPLGAAAKAAGFSLHS